MITSRWTRCGRARRNDRGASLVEYSLLVALVAVVCMAAVTMLGGAAHDEMTTAGDGIGGTTTAPPAPGCSDVRPGAYATGPEHLFRCWDPATSSGFNP